MSQESMEFFSPLGPGNGKPTVFSVTTASVHVDLTGASYATLKADYDGGRLLSLKAEGDVYYRWSPNTSGDTVDETMIATGGTPANQCSIIFAGEHITEKPPPGTKGIVIKAPVACKLRIYASSKNPNDYMVF